MKRSSVTLLGPFLLLGLFLLSACGGQDDFSVLPDPQYLPPVSCNDANVRTLTLPIDYNDPNRGTFEYAYQIYEGEKSSDPSIIFIPGGPGQNSIGLSRNLFPAGTQILLTDPRGIGCQLVKNPGLVFPPETLRSDYTARDILHLIEHLQIERPFLYGISYGTVVATIAGKLAPTILTGNLPEWILLEGTVGKGHDESLLNGLHTQWERTKGLLSESTRRILETEAEPLSLPADDWMLFLKLALNHGDQPEHTGWLINTLEYLKGSESDRKRLKKWIKTFIKQEKTTRNQSGNSRLASYYFEVGCSEIWGQIYFSTYAKGSIQKIVLDDCKRAHRRAPYDSKEWQSDIPKLYLQGENDPSTPLEVAKYHFENQQREGNVFVEFKGGGHNPFIFTLLRDPCREGIWTALFEKQDPFSEINHCKIPLSISRSVPKPKPPAS